MDDKKKVITRRLAIIPARGGSKRIPDKNIRDFCGRPMLSYSLNAANDSGLFDCIHVSTDSTKIAETVIKLGFEIDFLRPVELSGDHTPIMPVLKYVTEQYRELGRHFDEVVLIMACAPLIDAGDLVNASNLMKQHNQKKQVLAVAPYPVPVEWAFKRNDDGTLIPVQSGMFSKRSQDIGNKYYDVGMFCFLTTEQILDSEGAGGDDSFVGYVLPKYKSVDIDNFDDWIFAEAIYNGTKSKIKG
jgi:pseudaminic acid cytidylyltransferase